MSILFAIAFFLLGTIVGSFLNVIIARYNTGQSLSGRSGCLSCSATLSWYDMFPVASFLVLRGKCRTCGSKISTQYPLVELLTGILFLGVFLKVAALGGFSLGTFPFILHTSYFILIMSLLMIISVYDFHHHIIPDGLVYTFIVLSLIGIFISFPPFTIGLPTLSLLLAGPVLFAPFFLLWLVSHGQWMGLGDAKLALGIGWFLGLISGISALLLAFWIGAVVSVVLLGLKKLFSSLRSTHMLSGALHRLTIKSEIPFGPFLVLGMLLVFFFDFNVLQWII